ncbi:sterol desaturase family protein [Erythrobacter rubeus]|uniref:Sterol desaturase family protein n=1 Tax=Erythrobacter rubeus TaxID=2760803 RepID=A0ABR8KQQ9_9SPHN|nr:sterol desaturase family protein [Erythrobacter rubeus]MBD2841655.1 sterol desaturase family protein [Erythrobacter rubeus]
MKQTLFNLLPPATLAVIWTVFGLAPREITEAGWLFPLMALGTLVFVQLMEFIHERHADWRMNRQEWLTDIFYLVFGVLVIETMTDLLVDSQLTRVKEALGIATPWLADLPFLLQVLLIMLLFEFGQYWMHRWMHNNAFLWSTHAPHHHLTQLNAMKGLIGNPIELFLISLSVIALFDFDENALFAAFVSLGAIAFYAHANIRSDPPAWFGFFFTTIRQHSLHHTALSFEDTRCNYSNSIILFDRIFGTFKDGESEVVGQDDRKRLTIKEQFLFPILPWLRKREDRAAN